jgi:hypothetical protein
MRTRSAVQSSIVLLCVALSAGCTEVVREQGANDTGSGAPFWPDSETPSGDTGGTPSGDTGTTPPGDATGSTDTVTSDTIADAADGTTSDAPSLDVVPPDAEGDATDAATPDTSGLSCQELNDEYDALLLASMVCTVDTDCTLRRPEEASGCGCSKWITADDITSIDALMLAYEDTCGEATCGDTSQCALPGNARCIEGECRNTPKSTTDCGALNTSYKAEVSKAKVCETSDDCRTLQKGDLLCGCQVFINENFDTTTLTAISTKYHVAACTASEECPTCQEPLAGVCSGGKCLTKYVTTP